MCAGTILAFFPLNVYKVLVVISWLLVMPGRCAWVHVHVSASVNKELLFFFTLSS